MKESDSMKKSGQSTYLAADEDVISIDLWHIINVLKKRRSQIIVITLLFGFMSGLLSSFVLKPVYKAQTLLMIPQATDKLPEQPTRISSTEDANPNNLIDTHLPVLTMTTYQHQLTCEALMNRIVKKLYLDKKYNAAVLAGMIDARVVQDSNLIEVNVTNSDPVLAYRIANSICDEYLKLMTEKNQELISRSIAFIDRQKKLNDTDLTKAEEKLKEFQNLPQSIAVANSGLNNVQKQIKQLNSSADQISRQLAATPQFISASADHNDVNIGINYNEQAVNPFYLSLSQQLTDTNTMLSEKQEQFEALSYQASTLSAKLNDQQANPEAKQLEQSKLQNEIDRLKKISDNLIIKKAQLNKSINPIDNNVIVVSPASIPTYPIKPNKIKIIAIALVMGMIISTFLAFMLEYFDSILKNPEEIPRELELPVLGMIPKITKADALPSNFGST